ncbi:MAG: Spx/MgsR family RNA polymerase-binding regulatory protein [Rhodospirillales bacterium]|jgi:arsenate reductase (glutaredoxin)|nr:Spx/MgsR family RNA polymerase-binding regulatory protein [Rhodospirillales bacterium]MBT4625136.1 Spx/MgsR family RNA polymerase-binding regulatory protein [Rhodospirillales bacterium]MBT5353298.1 Spx/MgsR family RNA polymerase-binding regulatory protein [Rhodospirillales bacterium]MBT5519691.1 Spx/MgsR family RNA polymerase-binding regulatory protein [Rhodospirillales bacterium]MBT6109237.1 Spx/MgsR family RNA polymerase-binding regulatory protein [Rhodospirillales bacterium]
MIVYGLKNCDTCRAAIKWLDAEGITHQFRDVRKDGLDAGDVKNWLETMGADTLVNRRGTTWRQLDEADKAKTSDADLADLILRHPAIMKRPVFVTDTSVIVGFKDEQKAALSK